MAVTTNSYMSYEEYIQNKKDKTVKYADDTYAAAETAAGTARDTTISYAAGERARAEAVAGTGLSDATKAAGERLRGSIAQADDTFERDKVTYGQAAERLAQAGLTGSGFSDNMTRDAFASRAALYSDANRTYAAEKNAAEVTYRDAMAKAESDEAKLKYGAQATYDTTMTEAAGIRDKTKYEAESDYDAGILALREENAAKLKEYTDGGYSAHTIADIDANFSLEDAAVIKDANMAALRGDLVDSVNYGTPEEIAAAVKGLDTLLNKENIERATYDNLMKEVKSDPTALAAMYKYGMVTTSEYLKNLVDNGKGNSGVVNSGWHIRGLGYGSEGDEIEVTIGGTEYGEEKAIKTTLGAKVEEDMVGTLNQLATGNSESTPKRASGWSVFWGGDERRSSEENGQLVVHNGTAYVYTQHGWFSIKGDGVAAAFLSDSTFAKTLTK